MIIDCHAHIYSADERRYPPKADPLRPPGGAASIEDLRATAEAHAVTAVRAIQSYSFYGDDNRYLCDTARANPDWVAGVCTLEPDDPNSPAVLRRCVQEYGVKTLRSIAGNAQATFDHDGVRQLWRACAELGATVDIFLMKLEWVAGAEDLLREFGDVAVGFDHCMDLKPGPDYEKKLGEVLRLSRYENLYAKVDFISTGTQVGYPGEDLHDAAMKIIDAYGAERCVWGSNFPNALWTPKMTYTEHLKIFTDVLPLSDGDRRQVLGETAGRVWFSSVLPAINEK